MAAALRQLAEPDAAVWITWAGERLRLAPATDAWLEAPTGDVIVATRRGYRVVTIRNRRQRFGTGPALLHDERGDVIEDDRVRALVVERHPRS